MRFSCNSLCQKGFTCSGRSNQKRSLGKLSSNSCIFTGIMKEVHYLLQGFLGLILEGYSCILLDISFGTALTNSHHSAAFIHSAHKYHEKCKQQQCWKQNTYQHSHYFTDSVRRL